MAHLTAGGILPLGFADPYEHPGILIEFDRIQWNPQMAHLTAGGVPPLGIVDSKSLPEILWNSIGIPETPKRPT